jgi:hypothetical protein
MANAVFSCGPATSATPATFWPLNSPVHDSPATVERQRPPGTPGPGGRESLLMWREWRRWRPRHIFQHVPSRHLKTEAAGVAGNWEHENIPVFRAIFLALTSPMQTRESTSDHVINRGAGGKFLPGASANKGGRPKVLAQVRDLARRHTRDAIRVLHSIATDEGKHPGARVAAATELLNRGWGRPESSPGPLVTVNLNAAAAQGGAALDPSRVYQAMLDGTVELDSRHPAFRPREVIDAHAVPQEAMQGPISADPAAEGAQAPGAPLSGSPVAPALPECTET